MSDHDQDEQAAWAAAERWLALVDAADYGEAWREAAPLMKGAVDEASLEASLRSVRGTFGALVSRAKSSATYATTLPGAPDGEYVVITTDATFEHKKAAIETITPMKCADGAWRVTGYFIR